MQFVALFIALPIAPPRPTAARAMPVPTIARIRAYSAAEAPLVSVHRFLIMLMIYSPLLAGKAPAFGCCVEDQQLAATGEAMQFFALFIALPMAPPRPTAARAMPVPTIARIRAYSAAEAPLVSVHRFLMMLMIYSPLLAEKMPGTGLLPATLLE